MDDVQLQREYYTRTAAQYDEFHAAETPPLALAFLSGVIETQGIRSVLDVGSGTGRVVQAVTARHQGVRAVGIEPVEALRRTGHARGVPADALIDGDATKLQFGNDSFDLVCAFSVLHHVPQPHLAIAEMLRVARRGVFILDANNFGQGGRVVRLVKQGLDAAGLWPLANWLRTRGRGYMESDGDGIFYSYSVFSSYRQIRQRCRTVHFLNVSDGGRAMYRTASVVAMVGLKT